MQQRSKAILQSNATFHRYDRTDLPQPSRSGDVCGAADRMKCLSVNFSIGRMR